MCKLQVKYEIPIHKFEIIFVTISEEYGYTVRGHETEVVGRYEKCSNLQIHSCLRHLTFIAATVRKLLENKKQSVISVT